MDPTYSISTACATANYCIYSAANHTRSRKTEIMIVGASESTILPTALAGFIACRALSQRNIESERASSPGTKVVMVSLWVVESLEHARKGGANIIAQYLGGAITSDAYHMTVPREEGLRVSHCIEMSLKDAGVSPKKVNYVNAHATSPHAGDIAEVKAIKNVFKDTHIKINATKEAT